MRLLYGYAWRDSQAVIDPPTAAVVSAVLSLPITRGRNGQGEHLAAVVLRMTRQDTLAVRQLVSRIRSHRIDYFLGRAHQRLSPNHRLRLTASAASFARLRPVGARNFKRTPSPRLPERGGVVLQGNHA